MMHPKHFFNRNKESVITANWFFRDFVLENKYRLIWISLLGLGAASIQASILVALNHIVTGGLDESLSTLLNQGQPGVMLGALVFVALGMSAFLTYLNGVSTLALWPVYQLRAVNQLLTAIHAAASRGVISYEDIRQSILPKSMRATQRLGAFTRVVTKSILPALRFAGFAIFAVIAEPYLTVVVFAIVVPVSGLFLLYFSRKASQCDRNAEKVARDSANDINELMRLNTSTQQPELVGGICKADNLVHRVDLLVERFIWVERARMATVLITVILLGCLIAILGGDSTTKWGELVVYLIALILAFMQLAALASSVSTFGRFYPTVSRHKKLLDILHSARTPEEFQALIKKNGLLHQASNDLEEDFV
jgi:ABC-type multidrug transport system fused ATPase/permease subunit